MLEWPSGLRRQPERNLRSDGENRVGSNIRSPPLAKRGPPGFEPGTSRTLNENHTPRPGSRIN